MYYTGNCCGGYYTAVIWRASYELYWMYQCRLQVDKKRVILWYAWFHKHTWLYPDGNLESYWHIYCVPDLQLDVKGCRDVYASFDKYVEVERLEGDNRYHAEQHGLQVLWLFNFLCFISIYSPLHLPGGGVGEVGGIFYCFRVSCLSLLIVRNEIKRLTHTIFCTKLKYSAEFRVFILHVTITVE